MVNAMAVLAGGLIIFAMLSVVAEVVTRSFMGRPLVWVIEISEYLLLYITFLGTPWLLREEGHVRVDILLRAVNPRVRAFLEALSSVVGASICLILVVYGGQIAWDAYRRGVYNPTILQFPKAPLLAVIPAGSLFLTVQYVRRLAGSIRDWQVSGAAMKGKTDGRDFGL